MSALPWTEALHLQHEELDRTHEEFVALLNTLQAALDGGPLPAYRELLAHTEAHFAMEEAWMAELGFDAENCHSRQHAMVLELMHSVLQHAEAGDTAPMTRLVPALAEWFPQHATQMDAALVETLKQKA
jgi:hemerythrin-like metal-binding protein